jgi:acetoin utilization deacetylase AcuC-like enzyme
VSTIPVYYSDELLAESDCRSPSLAKPKPVVEAWELAGLPIERREVTPATVEELCLAHDPAYVEAILLCMADNGFRNQRPDVARSLPYATGSVIGATQAALESGIASATGGGFHHASYATASMFCTFNGLCIAAIRLLRAKRVSRVLIVDCDFHYGNGTDDIIEHLGLEDEIVNASLGKYFCAPAQASAYLREVERLAGLFPAFDLVIFQAGADLSIHDPLGGVLDTEQMRLRDRIVFDAAKRAGVPCAWTLAGGYQVPLSGTIELHTITMQECCAAFIDARAAA